MNVSNLKTEAQRLLAAGEMPPLEELLKAIGETRQEFAPKILSARNAPEFKMTLGERAKGIEGLTRIGQKEASAEPEKPEFVIKSAPTRKEETPADRARKKLGVIDAFSRREMNKWAHPVQVEPVKKI